MHELQPIKTSPSPSYTASPDVWGEAVNLVDEAVEDSSRERKQMRLFPGNDKLDDKSKSFNDDHDQLDN